MNSRQRTTQQNALALAHKNFSIGMRSHTYFKVHNHGISDDLVQDAFMKTWKYLLKGGKIRIMKAFLYHTLNHLIIDEYRKNKPSSLDLLLEKGYEPSYDSSEEMMNILDGKSAMLMVKLLPAKYQNIIKMRYVQNLTLEEISKITGQLKNTVAVQAFRGLEKLKEIYNRKIK